MKKGGGAHWTWLQRDKENRIIQPPVSPNPPCLLQHQHLGMGNGIVVSFPSITSSSNGGFSLKQDGSYGHIRWHGGDGHGVGQGNALL